MTRNDSNAPVVAVVLAAGFGTRFDPDNPKQLVSLRGKAIVAWSIEAFESDPRVTDIIVVVNPKVRAAVERMVDEAGYPKVRMIIDGGAQRVDSTMAALDTLAAAGIPDCAKVLIHDAVRPFVTRESIDGCIDSLDEYEAATVAVASTDTVLLTRDLGDRKVVADVPDRPDTFRAQTPQAFRFATIRKAYAIAGNDPDFHPTDDTRVVVDYLPDVPVAIVAGSESNLKVTTLADMPIAERIAERIVGGNADDGDEQVDGNDGEGFADDGMRIRPMGKEEARRRMHEMLFSAASQMAHH